VLNSCVYDTSIAAVLEEVRVTADLEGVAIFDLGQVEQDALVSYSAGTGGADTISVGHNLLAANPGGPAHLTAHDKRPILACPWMLPPSRRGGVVVWRSPRGRRWSEADHGLMASLAVLLRNSVESGNGQIGFDRLTGVPNRKWFISETDRHIDRLDRDRQIGTLSLIDVNDLRQINATLGRAFGDSVLVRLAGQLRASIRPGDILARVSGDEFALWQNRMDHLTAAERADALCYSDLFNDMPAALPVTMSIGIASRELGNGEDTRGLLRRAHMAAREAKGKEGGGWHVSHGAPVRRTFLSRKADPKA
jgi:diguanylate cyclase (GGDEF)-like protein